MLLDIENLRNDYTSRRFDEGDADDDPFEQFRFWFQDAMEAQLQEPNAMTLATASSDGKPSARIVLLKGFSHEGFVFFTNYDSRKGRQIEFNPYAALVFLWLELHRQVRIEGKVKRLDTEVSTRYFQSRPKGSQIGAWASAQSRPIEGRHILEEEVRRLESRYAGTDKLPRPDNWGGLVVEPFLFEFWQGRPSRLHDRIRYLPQEDGTWTKSRLAP